MNYLSKENVQEVLELSLLQTQIYNQESWESASTQIEQVRLQLDGSLDPDAFETAVLHIIAQHPPLRTVFRPVRGRVVQAVLKTRPIHVQVLDLRGMEEDERASALDAAALADRQPFHLGEGPLVRVTAAQTDEISAAVIWTHHSAIFDERSRRLVQSELLTAYQTAVSGQSLDAVARPAYKDYLNWVNAQDRSAARSFWADQLASFETATPLFSLAPSADRSAGSCVRTLSTTLSERLKRMAQTQGVTGATLVQAAWALLLNLYSREERVTFGNRYDGRPASLAGAEQMVGRFANLLPLHVLIDGEEQVAAFLKRLWEQTEQMSRFAMIPLAEVRDYAGLASDQELFTHSLHLDLQLHGTAESGVKVVDRQQGETTDFALHAELGERWQFLAAFAGERLDEQTVAAQLAHLEALLHSMVDQPDARIRDLQFLPEADRTLLASMRGERRDLGEQLAHQVIESCALTRPEQIAAICEAERITYRTLNEKANRMAHFLREQNVGRDDLVALFAERGIDMLIAILAVLKAGGAYVPLDPAHPDVRLAAMVESAGIKVILTEAQLFDRSCQLAGSAPVCLLDDWEALADQPVTNPDCINLPGDLANVFFTSGSTGLPKGAMVEHIGMLNHLYAKIDLLELNETSVVAQNASHCFDISVWQFLAPLMVGGTVAIFQNEIAIDPQALLASVQRTGVTILEMVPAVIEMFLQAAADQPDLSALPKLRYMISTGEGLRSRQCLRWLEAYPHVQVVNTYGATECSDDTSHKVIGADQMAGCDLDRDFVTLGTSIPNINTYVLDRWQRPVPVGCTGEICMTGIGVGRGYLNDPERTAKAFVANPFADGLGERMYKTGDLGRLLPDGRLEFVSRIDYQVKVRGHRIELGEVEAAILSHEAVQQAVAIVRPDAEGLNRILAYVILSAPVEEGEWWEFLQDRLPDYMIPAHILSLDAFPLNRNGKVDRKALPEPEAASGANGAKSEPQTEMERSLAVIWGEILERQNFGMEDSFFHVGGHSLKMIQIRSRIKKVLGIDIPLKTLFANLTIRQLAEQVSALTEESGVSQTIPVMPKADVYPMSHAQRRLYFIQQLTPDNTAYNMPVAYTLQGTLNTDAFVRAFQTIIDRHGVLRTTFTMRDGEPVQQIAEGYRLEIPQEDLSGLAVAEREAEVQQQIDRELETPFDLERGPVIRIRLLKLEAERHLMLITMHHIVSDFWSWGVLYEEFYALYEGYANDRDVQLSPLSIQYRDYASWQNNRLQQGLLAESEAYWRQQLSGDLPTLDLPTDHPRPALQKFEGDSVRHMLDRELNDRLVAVGNREEATLFMVLFGALGAFLARMSGQQDIVIGTPEAGRNVIELEQLIGFFINTMPLRLDLGGDPTVGELLQRAKKTALDAYAHHEYPFDLMVDLAKQERELSRSPLFSVMFQVVRKPEGVDTGGLKVAAVPIEKSSTAFDLAVTFVEREEGLELSFDYRTDLFERATIERWMGHFEIMLHAIVSSSAITLSELPLLAEADLRALLGTERGIVEAPTSNLLVHQLFEAQVERTPDRIAIQFEADSLTYRELNERANRLARYLQSVGAGPETMVGICLPRNLELVISLLAVLKAGSAFVPLDPAYPEERLAFILADAKLPLLITSQSLRSILASHSAETLMLDADIERYRHLDASNLQTSTRDEHLVYLIYTSGSTGRPKAVMVEHRHLRATLLASQQHFEFAEGDVFPWIASFAFDIAYFELFNPLLVGAKSVVLEKEHLLDLPAFVDQLPSYTMIHTVPSLMRQIVDLIRSRGWDASRFERLRTIFIGGDAVPPELVREMQSTFAQADVHILYGPTEASIICSHYPVPRKRLSNRFVIGSAMSHARIRLYDRSRQLVPIGVPGELYIGGAGVTRGYLGRPELTAEQFVEIDGERWYRSGDLARFTADGMIDFLGRIDNQVKIRGFRIELGEIESVLGKHPAVSEVIVLARELEQGTQGDKQLVAYVTLKEQVELSASDLRSDLQAQLPEHMMPSFFILLEQMPMTATGKIDRKQLPLPSGSTDKKGHVAPRDRVELEMTQLWEDVLAVRPIGLYDNFFELGGHSLKAVALMEGICQRFEVEMPLSSLFRAPTVEKLCRELRGEGRDEERSLMVLLKKGDGTRPPLFLLPPQGGGVMGYLPLVQELEETETIYGVQSVGYETEEAPLASMEEISTRFLEEIKALQPEGPYRLAGWSFGGVVAYDLALRLERLGDEVVFLGLFDVLPIDPESGMEHADQQSEEVALLHQAAQLELDLDSIRGLSLEEGLDLVLSRAHELGRLPEGTTPAAIRKKMQIMMRNGIAGFSYVPTDKVQTDLTLFRCSEVPSQENLFHPLVDPERWRPYTRGNVEVIEVPGDHHNLFKAPNVQTLADSLNRVLGLRHSIQLKV
ncbi:amino acid adenylation domain-containing protein [Tumebacillus lipolyticus]|uniref:Amino acid adenylation domain-containing protein n=1 Tax=Tumebacillus lipolyticus TaxID=1280370 RepID=A0ABW4ZTA0_9BACL